MANFANVIKENQPIIDCRRVGGQLPGESLRKLHPSSRTAGPRGPGRTRARCACHPAPSSRRRNPMRPFPPLEFSCVVRSIKGASGRRGERANGGQNSPCEGAHGPSPSPLRPFPRSPVRFHTGFPHLIFSVARPMSAKRNARIQNRTTTCVSFHPPISKWWWMGAQRKTRFLSRSL